MKAAEKKVNKTKGKRLLGKHDEGDRGSSGTARFFTEHLTCVNGQQSLHADMGHKIAGITRESDGEALRPDRVCRWAWEARPTTGSE